MQMALNIKENCMLSCKGDQMEVHIMIKDGWHTIAGFSVYVEDGHITRAMKDSDTLPASVYRWKNDGWTIEYKITPAAFRAGVKRGTITVK